jgi:hypothetical protein
MPTFNPQVNCYTARSTRCGVSKTTELNASTLLARLLTVALVLYGSAAFAQEVDEIILVNGMENSIVALTLSPPGVGVWSDNLLSPPPIEPGEGRKIAARPFAEKCIQDVRAKLAVDGEVVEWKKVKFCGIKKLGLFRDRSTGAPSVTYE